MVDQHLGDAGPGVRGVLFASMIVAAMLQCASCASEASTAIAEPPLPDRATFDTAVYPMLLRDCAFSECHGASHRFFQVFGPGRSRLSGHPSDPDLGPRERQLSYDRTRSMLVASGGGSIFESALLTKPLEVSAGGASHEGVDRFGRNIFQTSADPRFVMLAQWAVTRQSAATTTPSVAQPTMQPTPATPSPEPGPGPTVGALLAADAGQQAAPSAEAEVELDASSQGSQP